MSLFTRSCALLQNNILNAVHCSLLRPQKSNFPVQFHFVRPTTSIKAHRRHLVPIRSTMSTTATGEIMFLTMCTDNSDKCGGDGCVYTCKMSPQLNTCHGILDCFNFPRLSIISDSTCHDDNCALHVE